MTRVNPMISSFRWDDGKRTAAQLLAEGELGIEEIAEKIGVTRQSIWNWRKDQEFMEAVDAEIGRINESLRRRAISHVERRVESLNSRWLKLHKVIESRAVDPAMKDAAGGETGLLVRTERAIGSGELIRFVDEFSVDVGLLKELREIEKQAAIELKQWTEKADITSGGLPISISVVEVVKPANAEDSDSEAETAPGSD